ncbi:neuropeptide FF receptor 2-like [Montipora capricornis]|uniref:neuropeptide FF receptor 2-like n=1 Tax=Montipora capricornis TaxID=246305 RepID=UPI0035F205A2
MAMRTFFLVYAGFEIALILFNILGNSLVCLLILKNKAMKTSRINWLLFQLAVADLLVAMFFVYPCFLSNFIKQPGGVIGDVLCKFATAGTLGWAASSTSSFLLVAIAFERYFATLYPFRSLSRRRSWLLVPLVSFLGILLIVPLMIILYYDEDAGRCTDKWPTYSSHRAYSVSWSFCNSALPICMMGYLYSRIIRHLRNNALVPGCSQVQIASSRTKVTRMLISVTVIFVVCWIPQVTLCLLSPVIPGGYGTVSLVATISALLNSCVNPVIYSLHSQQFRRNLASLMCRKKRNHSVDRNTNQTTLHEMKFSFSRLKTDACRLAHSS